MKNKFRGQGQTGSRVRMKPSEYLIQSALKISNIHAELEETCVQEMLEYLVTVLLETLD